MAVDVDNLLLGFSFSPLIDNLRFLDSVVTWSPLCDDGLWFVFKPNDGVFVIDIGFPSLPLAFNLSIQISFESTALSWKSKLMAGSCSGDGKVFLSWCCCCIVILSK